MSTDAKTLPTQNRSIFALLKLSITKLSTVGRALILPISILPAAGLLSVFRQIGDISKNSLKKQTWDEATHELLNDQAVFQVLGDWVIGELNTEKISIPDHIACYVSPQTSGTYIYNMDSFVIFNHNAGSLKADSDRMAKLLSAKTFQEEFSK